MSITFKCSCGKTLRVADEKAGKKARCPGCKEIVEVPSSAAATANSGIKEPKVKAVAIARKKVAEEVVDEDIPRKKKKALDQDDGDGRILIKKKKAKKSQKKLVIILSLVGVGLVSILGCAGLAFIPYFMGHGFFFLFGGSVSLEDHLKYVPDNCTMIESTQMDRIRRSSLYKDLKADKSSGSSSAVESVLPGPLGQAGITFEDIDRQTIARTADGGSVTITSVSKNVDIGAIATTYKYKESKAGNYTMYLQNDANAIAMPQSKIFLNGTAKMVEAVLKRDKKADLSDNLKKAMDLVDFSKCHAQASVKSGKGDMVFGESAEMSAMEADMTSDVKTKVISQFKDADTAQKEKKKAEEFFNQMRKAGGQANEGLPSKIDFETSDNRLIMTMTMSGDEVRARSKGKKLSGIPGLGF